MNPYSPAAGLNSFPVTMPSQVSPIGPLTGSGSPEGVVAAPPGTTYTDTSNPGVTYVKAVGVQTYGWKLIQAQSDGWNRLLSMLVAANSGSGGGAAGGIGTNFGTTAQRDAFTPTSSYYVWYLMDSDPPYQVSLWVLDHWV